MSIFMDIGDKFRALYGEILCLHSFIPSGTHIIASTATATEHIKSKVRKLLQMSSVIVLCELIKYMVLGGKR